MQEINPLDTPHIPPEILKKIKRVLRDAKFVPPKTLGRLQYAFILIATLTYLIFEIAFSAKLLDVVSQSSTQEQIDQIERVGRLLSGIALTLVIWGSYTLPELAARRVSGRKLITRLGYVAVLCCLFSYAAQEVILRSIVSLSSAETRRQAAGLQMIAHSLEDGDEIFGGHTYDKASADQPSVMTYRALLPVIGLMSNLQIAPQAKIIEIFTQAAKDELGDSHAIYRDAYLPAMSDGLSPLYEGYQELNKRYENGLDEYERVRRQLWNEHGPYFISVSRRAHPGPTGGPTDSEMREFESEYLRGEREKIDRTYRDEMRKNFGERIVAGLTLYEFAGHPAIQNKIQRQMGIKDQSVSILPGLSQSSFETDVYQPLLFKAIVEAANDYIGSPSDYEVGGKLERVGAQAVKASYVTLIALTLSLLGSIVHVWKVMRYAIKVVNRGRRRQTLPIRKVMLFANLTVFLLLVFHLATTKSDFTAGPVFAASMEGVSQASTIVPAILIESAINAENILYPIAKTILTSLPSL